MDDSRGIRWVRVLAAVLVIAVAAEIGARVFVRAWAGEPFSSLSFYVWSPYGLVRNNPRLTSPKFKINANGFRNVDTYSRAKPADTYRVLMVGGSVLYSGLGGRAFLEGEGRVGSDATMASYLEKRLREDPLLAGKRVEVINAAVNFNRIVEVATSYISEYVFWEPDLVIVCGSSNNFPPLIPRALPNHGASQIRFEHVWRAEFDRIVNDQSFMSWAERSIRALEEHSAAAAVGRRAMSKALDRFVALTSSRRVSAPPSPPPVPAVDSAETETLFREYAGLADAMIASAKVHDQQIAFFWEYYLVHLPGLKPLTPDEQFLRAAEAPAGEADRAFNFRLRDRFAAHLDSAQVPLVDPLAELRASRETIFIDYLHYTRAGNRFMADVMYTQLRPMIAARLNSG